MPEKGPIFDQHLPKRKVIANERRFYNGSTEPQRGSETDQETSSRLYEDWYRTHQPRMPYYPPTGAKRAAMMRRRRAQQSE